MGIFKKIGKAIHNTSKEIYKTTKNVLGKDTVNWITHPMEAIGRTINDITGVTSSARQQAKSNEQLQKMAQNYNAEQAQIERDWQSEMSNTAQQRAVTDAQKAGINPVLMAGAGASSGSGAVATSPGGSTGAGVGSDPIHSIAELIKAVNNTAKTNAEIDNIKADTKNKEQDYNLNEPDQETSKALKWWNSTWAGKAFNVAGDTIKKISPIVDTATNVSRANSARRISKSQRFK